MYRLWHQRNLVSSCIDRAALWCGNKHSSLHSKLYIENNVFCVIFLQILCDIDLYLRKQPSLVDINIPEQSKFTICGDIHGQFYDLMNIFKINGLPSETNPYLFNGDFVDRGSFSVECIFTLFGFKLLFPNHFYLSRGNHESYNMNQMYGFSGEVVSKYTATMSNMFTQVYNWLPLCHCLNKRVLVMHGGLFAQDNVTLDDLRKIERNRQPPEEGLMCDLLWSDPQPQNGRGFSKRGVGIQFGPDITEKFCTANKLDYVVRSHEVKSMGYEVAHNGKCITVFSAPNYWWVTVTKMTHDCLGYGKSKESTLQFGQFSLGYDRSRQHCHDKLKEKHTQ